MSESTSPADAASMARSPELLDRDRSYLLVVDVQEKLLPVIEDSGSLTESIQFLLGAAEALSVPVYVSEQYPKGLGRTVAAITDHPVDKQIGEKLRFSAAECFLQLSSDQDDSSAAATRDQVVIIGIEAHICVLQTALDLVAQGLRVFVVADAVGSRRNPDRINALERIRDAGGVVCAAESVAFEWCESAGADGFRQISRLIRQRDAKRG